MPWCALLQRVADFLVGCSCVSQVLLKELQRVNAGRVTFMPLNRLRPSVDTAYPDSEEAIPMMDRLNFKPIFRPAMLEVFRKGLIVRVLEVGTRFARCLAENCVRTLPQFFLELGGTDSI